MRYKTTQFRLGDIATMKYGKMPEESKKRDFGYPIFTGYKISGYYDEYMYKEPQLVVVARGVGGTGDVKLSPPYSFITNLSIIIELNEEIADKYYMKLYLSSLNLRYLDSGSAQSQITINDLKKLRIDIPDVTVQKRISHTIKILEDKIALNNQIISNLEQLAQTLFKRWFIDFEFPNEHGEPYRSSGGKMVESELGMIPEEWKLCEIGAIIELAYGKPLKKNDRIEGPFPVYGSNGIVDYHNQFVVEGPGIIIGRKGNPGTVNFEFRSFYPIDTTYYVIRKNEKLSWIYLYFMLKNQKLESLNSDSAVPGLNRNIVYKIKVIVPSEKCIEKFTKITFPLYKQKYSLEEENRKLIELRDTLLPKLLSGEIELPDEEEVTEDVMVQ